MILTNQNELGHILDSVERNRGFGGIHKNFGCFYSKMDEDLNSSELGTLNYWEDSYSNELQNFNNHGDVGEVWFGELISKKLVKWIVENPEISKNDNIIDIGCGNGMLLIQLSKKGYTALHGIDYSKNGIDLAQSIAVKENVDIKFTVSNVLQDAIPNIYDVALDKGAFDAISLDPCDSKTKRETYIVKVSDLLKKDGTLLITSCNWTEEELKNQFVTNFRYVETLPTPSFTFGGQKGNSVTSVVFRKS